MRECRWQHLTRWEFEFESCSEKLSKLKKAFRDNYHLGQREDREVWIETLLCDIIKIKEIFFKTSITSDTVRIVKELFDEILSMVHLGKIQETMDGTMTDVKSEVMEEHDWVKQIEEEEQEKFVKKVVKSIDGNTMSVECELCLEKCICEELFAERKEVIGGMERSNRKDIVIEKEEKIQVYKTMGFNWKEVDPISKGDFRYVYIDLIGGFSASNFRKEILLCKDFDMSSNLSVIN